MTAPEYYFLMSVLAQLGLLCLVTWLFQTLKEGMSFHREDVEVIANIDLDSEKLGEKIAQVLKKRNDNEGGES